MVKWGAGGVEHYPGKSNKSQHLKYTVIMKTDYSRGERATLPLVYVMNKILVPGPDVVIVSVAKSFCTFIEVAH